MALTQTENEHALAIKEMVESLPDLDNLSDFMYAQLAIVCKDNLDDILERCYALQTFRQEYDIHDTFQEGSRGIQHMFDLFPEEWLSFAFGEKDGAYVFMHDISKFEPRAFTTLASKNNWLKGMYYCHFLFFPDWESIRKGIICVCECEYTSNVRKDATKAFSQFFSEFLTHYPFIGCCHFYHTSSLVNIVASILRKILPKELRNTF